MADRGLAYHAETSGTMTLVARPRHRIRGARECRGTASDERAQCRLTASEVYRAQEE